MIRLIHTDIGDYRIAIYFEAAVRLLLLLAIGLLLSALVPRNIFYVYLSGVGFYTACELMVLARKRWLAERIGKMATEMEEEEWKQASQALEQIRSEEENSLPSVLKNLPPYLVDKIIQAILEETHWRRH